MTLYEIPIKIVSEYNSTEHWSVARKRHKRHQLIFASYYRQNPYLEGFPCIVYLTRYSPRFLDKDDNLPGAFKWLKDQIASELIPGKRKGMADSDPRIKWEYGQVKTKDKKYYAVIQILPIPIQSTEISIPQSAASVPESTS